MFVKYEIFQYNKNIKHLNPRIFNEEFTLKYRDLEPDLRFLI